MESKEIKLGNRFILKKPHACGENLWEVTRLGVDIKLKCLNCNHEVMMPRVELLKKIKKKVDENNG